MLSKVGDQAQSARSLRETGVFRESQINIIRRVAFLLISAFLQYFSYSVFEIALCHHKNYGKTGMSMW